MKSGVAIFSDLHIGPGDARDDFGDADLELEATLRFLRQEGLFIVGAGDLVSSQASVRDCERAHPVAFQAIEDYADVIISGNHDPYPWMFGKATWEGYRHGGLWIEHGHRHDRFNHGRLAWIGRAGAALAGWAERYVHRDADLWLMTLANIVRFAGRYGNPAYYRARALEIIEKDPRVERVAFGHTHRKQDFDGLYANAGTWTGGRRDFVIL